MSEPYRYWVNDTLNDLAKKGKGDIGRIRHKATKHGLQSLTSEERLIWDLSTEELRPTVVKGNKGGLVRQFKGGGKVRMF
mgnify:CR=1 FL=1